MHRPRPLLPPLHPALPYPLARPRLSPGAHHAPPPIGPAPLGGEMPAVPGHGRWVAAAWLGLGRSGPRSSLTFGLGSGC